MLIIVFIFCLPAFVHGVSGSCVTHRSGWNCLSRTYFLIASCCTSFHQFKSATQGTMHKENVARFIKKSIAFATCNARFSFLINGVFIIMIIHIQTLVKVFNGERFVALFFIDVTDLQCRAGCIIFLAVLT